MAQDFLLWKNDIEHRYSPTSLTDAVSGDGYTATAIISSVTTNSSFRDSQLDAYFDLRNKLLGVSDEESIGILPRGTTAELAALTGVIAGQSAENITVGRNEIYDGTGWKPVNRKKVTVGITASTTQTQGNGLLSADLNIITTVANNNDTVTLPVAAKGITAIVVNKATKKVKIFPNTDDDLGDGLNSSISLAAGSSILFHCYDTTNWVSA